MEYSGPHHRSEEHLRAHYLQHVPFEGLGSIEPWLREARFKITSTRFFESTHLPPLDDVDLLIVLGGPMSINDEKRYPWLVQEKQFIRRCIEAGKSVLGICLGAQLIANAMGARVYRHDRKEIGWFPVQAVPQALGSSFCFPPETLVLHWHGETFDLPDDAILLARSEACHNQAFQLRRSVVGLQFHLETTAESAREMVKQCQGELSPAQYVQSAAEILGAKQQQYDTINRLMTELLFYLSGSSD